MALAKNTPRIFEQGDRNEFPVAAASTIYEGSAVGINTATGYARALAAGDLFVGFAEAKADNAAGAAGAINVRVHDEEKAVLAVSGAVITDVGKAVYASDDDTFVFTQSTNSYVGRVVRFISSGVVLVAYEKCSGASFTELTAATGTPGNTVADVGAAFNQATLNDNFASLAAKLNAVLRTLK